MRSLGTIGALAFISLLLGCGSTKVSTKVDRAPWISIKKGSTVHIDLSVACEDVFVGPERVPKPVTSVGASSPLASLGVGISRDVPKEERRACADEAFLGKADAAIRSAMQRRMAARGLRVVQAGEAASVLVARVNLQRTHLLRKQGDRVDGQKDKACTRTCGVNTCAEYVWQGLLELNGEFVGADFPGVGPQRVERVVGRDTVAAGLGFDGFDARANPKAPKALIGCSTEKVKGYFDEENYAWDRALGELVRWLDSGFERMFSPYREDYDVVLLSDDDADSKAGIAAAERGDWPAALTHFGTAAQRDVEGNEPKAKRRYNLAVAQMQAGRLEDAAASVAKALTFAPLDEAKSLQEEIQTRVAARAKM